MKMSKQKFKNTVVKITQFASTAYFAFLWIPFSPEKIVTVGIDDPAYAERHGDVGISIASETINELFTTDGYRILLSHRQKFFDEYMIRGRVSI